MEEIVYHTNYKLEDNYWWFVARNRIIYNLITTKCNLSEGSDFLDAGCGTGGFTNILAKKFNVIGLDSSALALEYCRKRGLKNLYNMTLGDFPAGEWNLKAISMLDVIEHIEDDSSVVREVYEKLPIGGYFVASVPAYRWLWSRHDEVHKHFRRYNMADFKKLLESVGFHIEYSTYINTLLLPVVVLKRALDRITGGNKKSHAPVEEVPPWMNKLFQAIFLFEGKILKFFHFPFGLTAFVIARKKM